jgi:hypothetical protein
MRIYSPVGGDVKYAWREREVLAWPRVDNGDVVAAAPDSPTGSARITASLGPRFRGDGRKRGGHAQETGPGNGRLDVAMGRAAGLGDSDLHAMLCCFSMDPHHENHDDSPVDCDAGFATTRTAG